MPLPIPEFPGPEMSQPVPHDGFTEYAYDHCRFDYVQTTDGSTIILPNVEHWAYTQSADGTRSNIDQAPFIPDELLTDEQRDALNRARVLDHIRTTGGSKNTATHFSALREVIPGRDGRAYLCAPQEGYKMVQQVPFALARSLRHITDIDFVTRVRDGESYLSFLYDAAEIPSFFPPDSQEANAYYRMEFPRIYTGESDNRQYQFIRLRLFQAVADLDIPLTNV